MAWPRDAERQDFILLRVSFVTLASVLLLDFLAVLRLERLIAALVVVVLCSARMIVRPRYSRGRTEFATAAASGVLLGVAAFARLRPDPLTFALYVPALALVALAARDAVHRSRQQQQQQHAAVRAREEERRRWARELHDGPVQTVIGVRTLLATARQRGDSVRLQETVDRVVTLLDHEDAALRALVVDLRPPSLGRLGLCDALAELAERTTQVHGLPVDLTCQGLDDGLDLSDEAELTVYRVVQEALSNAVNHAAASRATIGLTSAVGHWLRVTVSDDGRGLSATDAGDRAQGGHGLVGMLERAELVRGRLDLSSSAAGTVVDLRVPGGKSPARL